MSKPPFMTANKYHNPRTFNHQWNPLMERQHPGYQRRPYSNFGSMKNPTTEGNGENWCETCDREFPTAEILARHKQQHEKCNIDGCQFVAHPKVITKHIQMQHSSGLYKKIAKLQDPEEIQKWREERKKKYPTRINIEKKAAECKEKIERGEKMALKKEKTNRSKDHPAGIKRTHDFDKKNQNHKNNRSNFNQRPNTFNQKKQHPPKKVPKVIPKVPSVVEKNKLIPFTGILSICMDDDTVEDVCNSSNNRSNLIEDDFYEEPLEQPIERAIQEPVLCGALTSLMCDYGSTDEETDTKENNMPINVTDTNPQYIDRLKNNAETINDIGSKKCVNSDNNIDKDLETISKGNPGKEVPKVDEEKQNAEENSDNDSGPEEVATVKMNIVEPILPEVLKNKRPHLNPKKTTTFRNDHKNINRYKHKVPSTLLQKLLHKEIRQERNIVLQCIRYIKKMNYFDKNTEETV